MVCITPYEPKDFAELVTLFHDTVHTVNAREYDDEQLEAWAPAAPDMAHWKSVFTGQRTFVARDGWTIVGFATLSGNEFDHLFVAQNRQHEGIGSLLADAVESAARRPLTVFASITAKGFFEHRGYRVLYQQEVPLRGQTLTNFCMQLP